MNNQNQNLDYAKKDALFAYLELCNETQAVPEKLVYTVIYQCSNTGELDSITTLIESQHAVYQKEMRKLALNTEQLKAPQKKSFLSKLFKF